MGHFLHCPMWPSSQASISEGAHAYVHAHRALFDSEWASLYNLLRSPASTRGSRATTVNQIVVWTMDESVNTPHLQPSTHISGCLPGTEDWLGLTPLSSSYKFCVISSPQLKDSDCIKICLFFVTVHFQVSSYEEWTISVIKKHKCISSKKQRAHIMLMLQRSL